MATHKSAEKRARQAKKRALRNTSIKSRLKTAARSFREILGAADAGALEQKLKTATRELRKAASKGVIHKRTASRRVSRLVRAFNKASSSAAEKQA